MAYIANLPCVSVGKLNVVCLSILRYTFHFVSVGDDQAVIVLSVTKTWLAATNLLITEAYGKQDVTIRLIHCVGLRLPFQTSTSTALIIVSLKIGQWVKITSLTLSITAKSSGTWGMFSYIFTLCSLAVWYAWGRSMCYEDSILRHPRRPDHVLDIKKRISY